MENKFISGLSAFLERCNFYFSFSSDITRSAQSYASRDEATKALPKWQQVYSCFDFENSIIRLIKGFSGIISYAQNWESNILTNGLCQWWMAVIFLLWNTCLLTKEQDITIHHFKIRDRVFKYILISRRECSRTGLLFFFFFFFFFFVCDCWLLCRY